MTLTEMITLVRRDLHDEDPSNYRWTDAVLQRHIARALKDFSEHLPLEQKAVLPTVSGSREIDISTLADRIMIEAVEYPAGQFPPHYRRFSLWSDTLTLLTEEVPDGSDCCIYYGKLHTLDGTTSTVLSRHEDLVAGGAAGYAAVEMSAFSINKINAGGLKTPEDWHSWGNDRLARFRAELKRLGRRNRVRAARLYTPCYPSEM